MTRRRQSASGDFQASLGAISARLGDLVDALRHTAEEIAERQQDGAGAGGPIKTSIDIRVRGLAEDIPDTEERETRVRRPRASAAAGRSLLVEVFEEADAVLLTAEVGAAAEADVRLRLEDGVAIVEVAGAAGAATVGPDASLETAERSFLNGVLSVRFPRAKEG